MFTMQLTKKSAQILDDILDHYQERIQRGQELFLLELATALRRMVQATRVQVIGKKGRKYAYADHLHLSLVQGIRRADAAVAIWLDRKTEEVKAEDLMRTVLLIYAKPNAPAWVGVLEGVGPWPADLIPAAISSKHANVVARRVRPDEAQVLRDRLLIQRADIEHALKTAQAPAVQIASGAHAAGMRVYVDIAWEVLRAEFGYGDRPEQKAWRPALDHLAAQIQVAADHFANYMVDGKEAWFDVDDADTVGYKKVKSGFGFQQILMPFAMRTLRGKQ